MFNSRTLSKILDSQLNGVIVVDKNKSVIYANDMAKRSFLSELNMLLGNYLNCTFTILNKKDCQSMNSCTTCIINKALDTVIKTHETKLLEDIELNINGHKTIASLKIVPIEEFILIEFFHVNVNYKQTKFLAKLAEASSDLVMFKNHDLVYTYVNKSTEKFYNKSYKELIGKSEKELLPEGLFNQCYRGDLITLKEGKYSEIESFGDKHFLVSKELTEDGILCLARDITKETMLSKTAELDSLTKLYNRHKFMSTIDELYSSNNENYYLLVIDLDDLRNINNNYGHLIGDKYLCKLSEILNANPQGTFFRIGGDEFTGLIQGDLERVEKILDNIFSDLEAVDLNPKLSISVGATKLDINLSYFENFSKADKVLYEVKKEGKNAYKVCQ